MISKGSSVDFCLLLGYFAKKKLKWHLKYSFSYLKCSQNSEFDIKNTKQVIISDYFHIPFSYKIKLPKFYIYTKCRMLICVKIWDKNWMHIFL